MSISETIKSGFNHSNDWDNLLEECQSQSREIDQDWENESTQYTFVDGSCIVICGGGVSSYGCSE